MKKVLFALMVALAAVVTFSSCNKDEENEKVYTFVNANDDSDVIAFNIDSKMVVWTYGTESATFSFDVNGKIITIDEGEFGLYEMEADVNIDQEGWDKVKKLDDGIDIYKKK